MGKKKDRRLELLSLIPENAKKILDVGCGCAGLSAKLRKEGREIVGVERDRSAYEKAKEKIDKVFLANAEEFELPYPKGYFDCIIYADVLDCFKDPSTVLKMHKIYLKDGGLMIASMANIRYYKVIIRLIFGGTWDYTDGGILWKEHLRFFTLINIIELFRGAGFSMSEIKRNIVAARVFKFLNFVLLGSLKDFITYQYYIKAKKDKEELLAPLRRRPIYKF